MTCAAVYQPYPDKNASTNEWLAEKNYTEQATSCMCRTEYKNNNDKQIT